MAGVIVLLRMSAGLIVWAVAFCVLYGLHGIGCTVGWPDVTLPGGISLHRGLLIAAWAACIIAGAAVGWAMRSPRATLVERTGWRLAWVGLLATVITGLPVFVLPACL